MRNIKKGKGFTLIELLVVIAIIALLAAIIFIAISRAQASARDTQRKAEIDAIRKSLAVYEAEHGKYPEISTWESLETDPLLDDGSGLNLLSSHGTLFT